jgi:hypothetical protein
MKFCAVLRSSFQKHCSSKNIYFDEATGNSEAAMQPVTHQPVDGNTSGPMMLERGRRIVRIYKLSVPPLCLFDKPPYVPMRRKAPFHLSAASVRQERFIGVTMSMVEVEVSSVYSSFGTMCIPGELAASSRRPSPSPSPTVSSLPPVALRRVVLC